MRKSPSDLAHAGIAQVEVPMAAPDSGTDMRVPAAQQAEVYSSTPFNSSSYQEVIFPNSLCSGFLIVLLLLCTVGGMMYLNSRFRASAHKAHNDSGSSSSQEPSPLKKQTHNVQSEWNYSYSHHTENNKSPLTKAASKAIIYQSELDYLSRCILDYPNIETGGQFFGFWNDQGVPIVMYAIGPGPRAGHQVAFFLQDIEYLQKVGNTILRKYGLMQIGEWHSHHQLGLAQPSGHDAQTMSDGVSAGPFHRLLLCIGNCNGLTSSVNAFIFNRENKRTYHKVPWDVKPMNSPFRTMIDQDLDSELNHPLCRQARHGHLFTTDNNPVKLSESVPSDFWLSDISNAQICKKIRDALQAWDGWNVRHAEIKLDNIKQVYIILHSKGAERELIFPANFPNTAPKLILIPDENAPKEYTDRDWVFSGDIFDDVMHFCHQADSRFRSYDGGTMQPHPHYNTRTTI